MLTVVPYRCSSAYGTSAFVVDQPRPYSIIALVRKESVPKHRTNTCVSYDTFGARYVYPPPLTVCTVIFIVTDIVFVFVIDIVF